MKTTKVIRVALVGLMAGWALSGFTPQVSASENSVTVQETYLGKLEFQGQTITKETSAFLHRQILLQRATQLVTWAMPMMNFWSFRVLRGWVEV